MRVEADDRVRPARRAAGAPPRRRAGAGRRGARRRARSSRRRSPAPAGRSAPRPPRRACGRRPGARAISSISGVTSAPSIASAPCACSHAPVRPLPQPRSATVAPSTSQLRERVEQLDVHRVLHGVLVRRRPRAVARPRVDGAVAAAVEGVEAGHRIQGSARREQLARIAQRGDRGRALARDDDVVGVAQQPQAALVHEQLVDRAEPPLEHRPHRRARARPPRGSSCRPPTRAGRRARRGCARRPRGARRGRPDAERVDGVGLLRRARAGRRSARRRPRADSARAAAARSPRRRGTARRRAACARPRAARRPSRRGAPGAPCPVRSRGGSTPP